MKENLNKNEETRAAQKVGKALKKLKKRRPVIRRLTQGVTEKREKKDYSYSILENGLFNAIGLW